jgi:hypothetical protein
MKMICNKCKHQINILSKMGKRKNEHYLVNYWYERLIDSREGKKK